VGFGLHIPALGNLLPELGHAGNATRSGITISRVTMQQSARKYNEAIQEQGIVTPEMINSIQKRVQQLGPQFGLSPERFTGEGSTQETFAQFVTDLTYMLGTHVNTQGGETEDMRHAMIQSMASSYVPQIDRGVGFSWTSLEPTNFRTVPGRIAALVTAVAYEAGVVSNVMGAAHYGLDPRAIPFLASAVAGTAFAAYQATGAASGMFHANWSDTEGFRKFMNRFAWPALTAGTGGAALVNLYNAVFDPKNGYDKSVALAMQHWNPVLQNLFAHSATVAIANIAWDGQSKRGTA
jgi:hypothetical protein